MGTHLTLPQSLLLFFAMAKAMKAMKAMAAMKAMKAMKKKPISFKLARRHLFSGKVTKSKGGLTTTDFKKNKIGKIVSKKVSGAAKTNLGPWVAACQKAKKALNIT